MGRTHAQETMTYCASPRRERVVRRFRLYIHGTHQQTRIRSYAGLNTYSTGTSYITRSTASSSRRSSKQLKITNAPATKSRMRRTLSQVLAEEGGEVWNSGCGASAGEFYGTLTYQVLDRSLLGVCDAVQISLRPLGSVRKRLRLPFLLMGSIGVVPGARGILKRDPVQPMRPLPLLMPSCFACDQIPESNRTAKI